jgi:hypothetical protein
MNLRSTLGRVASIAIAAAGVTGLSLTGTASASAQPAAGLAADSGVACAFKTFNGHYLTAVDGGGRRTEVIHSDATVIQAWERFILVNDPDNVHVGFRTANGHLLTAVDGGGRTTDVIRSNETQLRSWEKFRIIHIGSGVYNVQTSDGRHYLTAVGGGGLTTDVVHTNATVPSGWEQFTLICGPA